MSVYQHYTGSIQPVFAVNAGLCLIVFWFYFPILLFSTVFDWIVSLLKVSVRVRLGVNSMLKHASVCIFLARWALAEYLAQSLVVRVFPPLEILRQIKWQLRVGRVFDGREGCGGGGRTTHST